MTSSPAIKTQSKTWPVSLTLPLIGIGIFLVTAGSEYYVGETIHFSQDVNKNELLASRRIAELAQIGWLLGGFFTASAGIIMGFIGIFSKSQNRLLVLIGIVLSLQLAVIWFLSLRTHGALNLVLALIYYLTGSR